MRGRRTARIRLVPIRRTLFEGAPRGGVRDNAGVPQLSQALLHEHLELPVYGRVLVGLLRRGVLVARDHARDESLRLTLSCRGRGHDATRGSGRG